MTDRYDLVILGGGTAGLVSAFIAAGVGARVALVERDRTGGDCLWTGCVPSKSLIAAARAAHRMRHADAVGLAPVEPVIDFARVMDRVHAAIAEIEPHDSPVRLRDAGVEVIVGEGHFVDGSTIQADGRRLRFASAIVATGSEPAVPPVSGLTGADVLTTESVWALRELPGRLVVLGGGPIGCELGQAFARLGASVTLVELADRLLLKEEPDAGALIAERLAADGVDVRLGTRAVEVLRPEGAPGQLVLDVDGERDTVTFDRVLLAAGRRPRTAGIGLEAAEVETDQRGAIVTDDRLRTSAPHIYAIGDVTARLPSPTSRRTTPAWHRATHCSACGAPSLRRSRGSPSPTPRSRTWGSRRHRPASAGVIARSSRAATTRSWTARSPRARRLRAARRRSPRTAGRRDRRGRRRR